MDRPGSNPTGNGAEALSPIAAGPVPAAVPPGEQRLVNDIHQALQDITGSTVSFVCLLEPKRAGARLHIDARDPLSQSCLDSLIRRLTGILGLHAGSRAGDCTVQWSDGSAPLGAPGALEALDHPLVLPLTREGVLRGLVGCTDLKPRSREEGFRALESLARLLVGALEDAQLLSQARGHLAETELLFEFGSRLAGILNLEKLQDLVRQVAVRFSPDAEIACLYLLEDVARGNPSKVERPTSSPEQDALSNWLLKRVLTDRRPVYCPDLQQAVEQEGAPPDLPYHSALAAPLMIDGCPRGILTVASRRPGAFDGSDFRLWTAMTGQVAVAVESAQLYGRLEQQKRHIEAVIGHLADGLIVLDHERRITSLNPAAEMMLGLSEPEVLGWSPRDLPPDPRLQALAKICEAVPTDSGVIRHPALLDSVQHRGEPEVIVDTPQPRVLKVLSSPIRSASDELTGEVKVLQDVTRERELDQMQRDFVSTVSHELRTPLFSVKGFVELILRGKVPDPVVQHEFLTRVADQANHLSSIVSDLLDTSRLEAGSVDLAREYLDIIEVVQAALAKLETVADSREVKLRLEAPPSLPLVRGDRRRLTQVVTNLVSNAIKFSPQGESVLIRCSAREDVVVVGVIDQGIGIPPEAIPRLFNRFYQVDSSATRRVGGTGLGLFISKRIIEAHRGHIDVESEVGRGSVFSFSIPTAKEEG